MKLDMYHFNPFLKKKDSKIVIVPELAPPPPKDIDELSPVFRKILNDVYKDYQVKYPHIFGTVDSNNNSDRQELNISSKLEDDDLASIELTVDKSRRNKRKIQNAEKNYLKIVGKNTDLFSNSTNLENIFDENTNPNPKLNVELSPNLGSSPTSKYPKIDSNLRRQINEAIVDYRLSDASILAQPSKSKNNNIVIHENIIIKPADPIKPTNFLSNIKKFAYKPKPTEEKKEPCSNTFFNTSTFMEPQNSKNINDTKDSISEKIFSVCDKKESSGDYLTLSQQYGNDSESNSDSDISETPFDAHCVERGKDLNSITQLGCLDYKNGNGINISGCFNVLNESRNKTDLGPGTWSNVISDTETQQFGEKTAPSNAVKGFIWTKYRFATNSLDLGAKNHSANIKNEIKANPAKSNLLVGSRCPKSLSPSKYKFPRKLFTNINDSGDRSSAKTSKEPQSCIRDEFFQKISRNSRQFSQIGIQKPIELISKSGLPKTTNLGFYTDPDREIAKPIPKPKLNCRTLNERSCQTKIDKYWPNIKIDKWESKNENLNKKNKIISDFQSVCDFDEGIKTLAKSDRDKANSKMTSCWRDFDPVLGKNVDRNGKVEKQLYRKSEKPRVIKKNFYNIEIEKTKPVVPTNFIQTKITDILKPTNKKEN